MKNIYLCIWVYTLTILTMIYLLTAFIIGDFNFHNWGSEVRGITVLVFVLTMLFTIPIFNLFDKK